MHNNWITVRIFEETMQKWLRIDNAGINVSFTDDERAATLFSRALLGVADVSYREFSTYRESLRVVLVGMRREDCGEPMPVGTFLRTYPAVSPDDPYFEPDEAELVD